MDGEDAKDLFWANNPNLMHLKVLAKGKLINAKGKNPKEAGFYGKWFFYGDGDMGINEIGYFKNGIKDSVWYTNYEDSFPRIKYYSKGVKTNSKGDFRIKIKDSLVAKGKEISKIGIPKGTWTFYYSEEFKSERQFLLEKDSVIVKFKNIDRSSGEIIEKGEFKEYFEDHDY